MRKLLVILMAMVPMALWAQFAPAAGQPGTTAMHADSSAFVAWATGCLAEPGPMNITNPGAGMAGTGWPASNAIGAPEGTMGVTCLGDGGMATLTFASPICNRPGPDFAVFENGFENAQAAGMYFLELGFVEVSSDGENFFRFPAVSMVQTETQIGGMGCIDPRQIHNFASKYEAMYGTPFDLDEIADDPLLDKENITHVRVIDVIGNIDPEYCTYDSEGHIVNDPWPTPFASCGMDLDAVGVIHDIEHYPTPPGPGPGTGVDENEAEHVSIYPNPAHDFIHVETCYGASLQSVDLYNVTGQLVLSSTENEINVSDLNPGVYFIRINCEGRDAIHHIFTERVIIRQLISYEEDLPSLRKRIRMCSF